MSVSVQGDKELQSKLRRARGRVAEEVQAVNTVWAFNLLESLQQHASGRPGPRRITGAYVAAMRVVVRERGMVIEGTNDSPQAARLEYGFVGVDSLGRHYNQPPYPHFLPAFNEIYPGWVEDLKAVPKKVMS